MFRELEKLQLKLGSLKTHRTFNETCLNNDLLPAFTNIHIYACICIYMNILQKHFRFEKISIWQSLWGYDFRRNLDVAEDAYGELVP